MRFIGVYDYTVILTYLSLFSAFGGMTFASRGMFNGAIACLLASGICDAVVIDSIVSGHYVMG